MIPLSRFYQKHWADLFSFKSTQSGFSNPLLIDCSAAYQAQHTRLFVIGQQTSTWYNACEVAADQKSVDSLIAIYRDQFRLGCGYKRIFWQAVRELEVALGIAPYAIAWSNLNRFDFRGSRPTVQQEQQMGQLFDHILRFELRFARPDVIVFFSGPTFDEHIRRIWPGAQFSAISPYSVRQLAYVRHRALPVRTFRTYHPRFLRPSGLWPSVMSTIRREA
jgi:hypothetical protein